MQKKIAVEEQEVQVNVEGLSSGVYIVRLNKENITFDSKLIIE